MPRIVVRRRIPRWCRPQDRRSAAFDTVGYVRAIPSGANTPDHSSLDITGDIDLRTLARVDDITTDPYSAAFIAKNDLADDSDSAYHFSRKRTATPSALYFRWRNAALTSLSQTSDAGIAVVGDRWYRVTMDVDDGAGNRVVTFYYSDQPITADAAAIEWVEHSQHVTAGTTDIVSNTHALYVGWTSFGGDGGTTWVATRNLYYAEVRNGIGNASPLAANPDFRDRDQHTTATTITDSTGKVWTASSGRVAPKQLALTDADFNLPLTRHETRMSRS